MELKSILRELCISAGVNGCTDASNVATTLLSQFTDNVHRDTLGNVIGFIPSANPDAKTLLLEAHIDEIGFVVRYIEDRGFLRLAPCGGVDNRALTASAVTVLAEPHINGVFCSVPPHVAKEDAKLAEVCDRGVDVGMTAEQAKELIQLGTPVMFAPHFEELLNDRVCSKALDNRAGVAAVLYALFLTKEMVLPFHIAVAFCVQEELGLRGSKTAAFDIKPDAALVVDVSFAHTPDAKKQDCGVLGKGVMLGISPILDKTMTDCLRRLSTTNEIPMQFEVMGGTTGTDADNITVSGTGVPTALLSIPLRYMHTPAEVVSLSDVEAVAQLIATFLKEGEVPHYA